jgi:hypothetical protein
MATNFKSGDKVIFTNENGSEILTLKAMEDFIQIKGNVWSVEENDEYFYQESYMRLVTPLDELL